jgi:AcrR family transcriptional regulator
MRKKRYESILKVASHSIATKGYQGTSFQEIADKVGLHKSSLFHYFKNKEQILLKILETPIDEVNSNLAKIIGNEELTPEEKLKKAIEDHLTLLTGYLDNVNVYLNETRSLSKKNQLAYLGKRKRYEKNFKRIF